MPSILVIYNPIAGRGRVKKHWPLVQQALINAGVEFDVAATSAPLDALNVAEKRQRNTRQLSPLEAMVRFMKLLTGCYVLQAKAKPLL